MVKKPPTTEEIMAFKKVFERNMKIPPTFTLLQGVFEAFDPEAATMENSFYLSDQLVNPAGNIQGGILTAAMDDTMGPLMALMSAGRAVPSSTDIHTQYYRPAKPGKYVCKAKLLRQGRRINYVEAELFDTRGRCVAKSISTAAMSPTG